MALTATGTRGRYPEAHQGQGLLQDAQDVVEQHGEGVDLLPQHRQGDPSLLSPEAQVGRHHARQGLRPQGLQEHRGRHYARTPLGQQDGLDEPLHKAEGATHGAGTMHGRRPWQGLRWTPRGRVHLELADQALEQAPPRSVPAGPEDVVRDAVVHLDRPRGELPKLAPLGPELREANVQGGRQHRAQAAFDEGPAGDHRRGGVVEPSGLVPRRVLDGRPHPKHVHQLGVRHVLPAGEVRTVLLQAPGQRPQGGQHVPDVSLTMAPLGEGKHELVLVQHGTPFVPLPPRAPP